MNVGGLPQISPPLVPSSLSVPGKETIKIGATLPSGIDGANLKAWFRADTGVTSDVNGVSAWANQGTLGGTLAQATNAKKPHDGHVIRGQAALSFDGGDELVSSLAASAWNFLHNGTGATLLMAYRLSVPGVVGFLDTGNSGSATALGICLSHTGTQHRITSGNGVTGVVAQNGKAGFLGGFAVVVARLKTGGSPAAQDIVDQGKHFQSAFANAAGAGDAPATLNVGALVGLSIPFTGFVSEIAAWGSYLTDEQLDSLEMYLAERYRYCGDAGA